MGQAQPVAQMETTDLQPWEIRCRVCRATGKGRGGVQKFWLHKGQVYSTLLAEKLNQQRSHSKKSPGNIIAVREKKVAGGRVKTRR